MQIIICCINAESESEIWCPLSILILGRHNSVVVSAVTSHLEGSQFQFTRPGTFRLHVLPVPLGILASSRCLKICGRVRGLIRDSEMLIGV